MVIVKLKVSKQLTTEHWINQALGTRDPHGNPFRLIKLIWNENILHRNTEYAKTRGFEDVVIDKNMSSGGFKILYRRNGSVSWQKPIGGVGSYFGLIPDTPYNRKKLVSHYGDKLWTIHDIDIDNITKANYEKMVKAMSKEAKAFNSQRISSMHVSDFNAKDVKEGIRYEAPVDNTILDEKIRTTAVKETDLSKKELELAEREKKIAEKEALLAKSGVTLNGYGKTYLDKLTLIQLRQKCKEFNIVWEMGHQKKELINMILKSQDGISGEDDSEIQPEIENVESETENNTEETLDS
jgi:hypothetical protein